jgi:hypothetical protein
VTYRTTKKQLAQWSADRQRRAQAARERNRMERPASEYPAELPAVRMRIVVERFDFGHETHVFELRRTNRVDVFAVAVDGKPWKRAGLTAVLEGLRKACPRVASARALA